MASTDRAFTDFCDLAFQKIEFLAGCPKLPWVTKCHSSTSTIPLGICSRSVAKKSVNQEHEPVVRNKADLEKRQSFNEFCLYLVFFRKPLSNEQDAINIIRFKDIRDETAVDDKPLDACTSSQADQPLYRFHLNTPYLGLTSKPVCQFCKRRRVNSGWQETVLLEVWNHADALRLLGMLWFPRPF